MRVVFHLALLAARRGAGPGSAAHRPARAGPRRRLVVSLRPRPCALATARQTSASRPPSNPAPSTSLLSTCLRLSWSASLSSTRSVCLRAYSRFAASPSGAVPSLAAAVTASVPVSPPSPVGVPPRVRRSTWLARRSAGRRSPSCGSAPSFGCLLFTLLVGSCLALMLRRLLVSRSPCLPVSGSAARLLTLARRAVLLPGPVVSPPGWPVRSIGHRILARVGRIVARALLRRLARAFVGRLILAGAAGAVARRFLAAAFFAAARPVAALFALRIALPLAARAGRRFLRCSICSPCDGDCWRFSRRLHFRLRIRRALALLLVAGAGRTLGRVCCPPGDLVCSLLSRRAVLSAR